ncbi:ubiquinol-cytochrome c reductase cytochrome c1 subunit [Candidatus Ruthia magnifica str. Cm (Calyptogena magnifica)]|uniref:Ubiquinol-cytochrome c reductase cytochrome c1 subunit n=1 Tax=Ruthia magnifica subsp. Calyptogena magnifica TaxID=413404 RepID=A1AV56_RUTMC|nr:cytochrome c1 [Candidatus Ruthturnera calyptogenae]ABL01813.1 ubiquinol-cytochrome c reductase cytochrome c1 subunit [Candidatus Ruthia magnifica str. Cm (Calyptogena magnifica)]
MKKQLHVILIISIITFYFNVLASTEVHLDHANTDINDKKSLQRGVKLFMNYCSGCHSIQFMRYNRIGKDLFLDDVIAAYEKAKIAVLNNQSLKHDDFVALSRALDSEITSPDQAKSFLKKISKEEIEENLMKATDKEVEKNLIFTNEKVGSLITSAMSISNAKQWFGSNPDLSLVSRSKDVDWIYSYLRGFYKDDSRVFGVNNHILENASMPDVLWQLKQNKSSKEFEQDIRDISNFLDYVGEPAKLVRFDLGIKVLGFLFILFIFSYLMKKEYWKDIKYGKWRTKN